MLMALEGLFAKRGDKLAPFEPFLHQPLSAHRNAYVVDGRNNR